MIETLQEAEEDHFLDCPNAELRLRVAALLLDVLLSTLAISGLQHLCTALETHLGHLPTEGLGETLTLLHANSYVIASYAFISLKVAFVYFYFVWSLAFAGGSPGKLLLGLRVIHTVRGTTVPFPAAFLREITKVFGIGFLFGLIPVFTRSDRRATHDLLCRTIVKRIHGRL